MEINTEEIESLPIWVQLYGLDIKYWGVASLSKIGMSYMNDNLSNASTAICMVIWKTNKQAPRKVWRVKQPCPAPDPPRSTPQTTADAKMFTSVPSRGTARSSPRHIGDLDQPHKQISQSDQHLHCLVNSQTTMQHFYLTFIYRDNHERPRQGLWAELEHIALDMNEAWCVLGDFNSALYSGDRIGGNPIQDHKVKSFTECIHSCRLQELPSRGTYFSWTNKTIWSKIDRAFVNTLWYLHFDFRQVLYMSHSLSDHTTLLLHLINSPKPRKAFHFCEMWTRDPSFQTIIHNMMPTVIRNPGQQLQSFLQRTQKALLQLNRDKYHDLRTQQLKAREALERIQMDLQASPNNEQLKLAKTQAGSIIPQSYPQPLLSLNNNAKPNG
ncbi:LOW QUALITY PROTEIN: hypothetical protein Cgig2_026286 [Carnegiea gigantea]|uniref:Endonuclease/exonuclease/phosphatase domain-containing protein n=1 Tax=Carnegiea gigantea TaxID=171969 RepID=A0A9Q1JQV8_9CARY|nr:LOW QUALITY PROTEIN: hypothetical protein Cgig2_026286 [Carnegiea gigantea]